MTKAERLEKIRAEHAAFESTLAQLSQAQMIQPGVQSDWSVKDVAAHLTTWQSLVSRWLKQAARGENPDRPTDWPEGYIDKFNNQVYEKNKDRPLAQVLDDLRQSCDRVLSAVQLLSEDDINNPNRYSWRRGEPILNLIAGNTYEHFAEHNEAIRKWLKKIILHP